MTAEPRDHVVFLLHGIAKAAYDMTALDRALRKRGYRTVNWKYPSRKHPVEELSDMLAERVAREAPARADFVTHSMGGIVVRAYLDRHRPKNLGRIVMIGPPSQGAWLAGRIGHWKLFRSLYGPAGQQLRPGDNGVCASLGVPPCEFGIIAGGFRSGGRASRVGMNPILPGNNDGTVSVHETHLDGAADFLLLPYAHGFIQLMPRTVRNTIAFLETGRFLETRQP
jgi:triacylglycerol lipase